MGFHNVWAQKISITPPPLWKVTGNSEGEGGSKAEISEGRSFSRGRRNMKNIESNAGLTPSTK